MRPWRSGMRNERGRGSDVGDRRKERMMGKLILVSGVLLTAGLAADQAVLERGQKERCALACPATACG